MSPSWGEAKEDICNKGLVLSSRRDVEDRNEESNEEASCKEEDSSGIWTLEFDGSCSSNWSSASIVLIPLHREPKPMAFK